MAKKNELALKDDKPLANSTLSLDDLAKDSGLGMEGADRSAYAIPFILLLQANSPQLDQDESARAGMFFNSVTNELYKELFVIPCAYKRRFIHWAAREAGGGYKGEYLPADVEGNRLVGATPDGYGGYLLDGEPLRDTRNHFVLVKSHSGVWQPAVIAMSSTQIKKSKRFMSMIQAIEIKDKNGVIFTPPAFSHIYKITSVKEENSKGSWWGFNTMLLEPLDDPQIYAKARAFNTSVNKGEVDVAPAVAEPTQEEPAF